MSATSLSVSDLDLGRPLNPLPVMDLSNPLFYSAIACAPTQEIINDLYDSGTDGAKSIGLAIYEMTQPPTETEVSVPVDQGEDETLDDRVKSWLYHDKRSQQVQTTVHSILWSNLPFVTRLKASQITFFYNALRNDACHRFGVPLKHQTTDPEALAEVIASAGRAAVRKVAECYPDAYGSADTWWIMSDDENLQRAMKDEQELLRERRQKAGNGQVVSN